MCTRAERNAREFDEFAEREPGIHCHYIGLWTRSIVSDDPKALQRAMERLTGSFAFEVRENVFYPNTYEITLPRIIIDFED